MSYTDTIVPFFNFVDIISDNAKHPTLAKVGDTVFLSLNTSEKIDRPIVELANRSALVEYTIGAYVDPLYYSCELYNATITVDIEDIEGNVSILVEFQDPSGNVGEIVVNVTRTTPDKGWVVIGESKQSTIYVLLSFDCILRLCLL